METILISAGVIAVAELGDKTQLLAILMVARFHAPVEVILGVLVATLVNHLLAATVGVLISDWLSADNLRWILAVAFAGIAAWMLLPESPPDRRSRLDSLGAFWATAIAFFLVEFGDTTQIATVALAAHFQSVILVVIGTSIGMMVADIPAVYFGEKVIQRLPMRAVRLVAASSFLLLSAAAALGYGTHLVPA
jgi:putative Ca2+/H+ antiporter (TMEM165/GDT1 family)